MTPKTYRKRPTTIQAVQWTGEGTISTISKQAQDPPDASLRGNTDPGYGPVDRSHSYGDSE